MLINNLKIAWRNLLKNKGTAVINLIGLSIGIAACLIIGLYIHHEVNYDQNVQNRDNLFRLYGVLNEDGKIRKGTSFSANTASTIDKDFQEITNAARLMDSPLFYGAGGNEIRVEGTTKQFHEDGFTYADQSFLDMFEIPMVYGDRSSALSRPFSIVISQKIAEKYFGSENPVGKSIYLNGRDTIPYSIGGVMENFPSNSHLEYDFLITLTEVEFGAGEQTRWLQSNYDTYLEVAPGTDIAQLQKKVSDDIIIEYMVPAFEAVGSVMANTIKDQAYLVMQPISDIHLYSGDISDRQARGDIKYIWMFGIVAIFILLIAAINFINLSTAQSANRAKEVGLRKVLGSGKGNLIGQFLTESILVSFIAFVLALLLVQGSLSFFNTLAGKSLALPYTSTNFILIFLGSALVIGFIAGIYPSFYLSAFNPIKVLKGKLRLGSKSGGLRSSLVVFQFTISATLIIGTLIINNQLNFILNKEVGFEKDQVLQIYGTNLMGQQVETFKNEIKSISAVADASISDYLPIEGTKRNGNSFWNEGKAQVDERVAGQAWVIDEDYLNTLGMELIEGRNFMKDRASDGQSVIINQTMAQQLNLENPVGKKITRGGNQTYEIIGIVKDFNFQSFRQVVEPLSFFAGISPSIVSVKVNTENIASVLQQLEAVWTKFNPDLDFRYDFMDQSFAAMYDNVSRIRTIFTSFAVLAIFIACLGLFALSAFVVEQRSKEMSIRKVLGATTEDIFGILTRNFVVLVLFSLVIAIPISVYLMQKWLQDFAYRVDLNWQVFVLSALIILGIGLLTVSYHALRSSLANPIRNLRNE
ncbi:MAG: ABC transporter permease [Saprospiraceae bacterium]|nr:ABC transporter permease [Saprospiraceae bacterium]